MQPRQRSKCSTTVSVSSTVPSTSASSARCARAASPSPRARARRSGTSAGRSRSARSRRSARAAHRLQRRARRAAIHAGVARLLDVRDAEARGGRAAPPRRPNGARPGSRACSARSSSHGSRLARRPSCARPARRPRARGPRRGRACRPGGEVDRARHELRAVELRASRAASVVDGARRRRAADAAAARPARQRRAGRASRRRACRGRSRRRSSRPCRPSSRSCRRRARRVTPITRSRIAPKRCRSGPERSSSRHSPSVGSPGGSSASIWPCGASASCSSRQPHAAPRRCTVRSPGSCSTIPRSEALGKPGPLQRMRAVRARHLAAEPRRREDLARVREPVRVEARRAGAASPRGRPRRTSSASSTPCRRRRRARR